MNACSGAFLSSVINKVILEFVNNCARGAPLEARAKTEEDRCSKIVLYSIILSTDVLSITRRCSSTLSYFFAS